MEITKASHLNDYIWSGLTLGKLLAIEDALKLAEGANWLGPVGQEVLNFLVDWDIPGQDCFTDLAKELK